MAADVTRPNALTLGGVLDYLQAEFRRFERERAKWDLERSDLLAKIATLEGEKKGQENLKLDLVRRIKMLEFALKNERSKNFQKPRDLAASHSMSSLPSPLPMLSRSSTLGKLGSFKSQSPRSRHILRQYLEEMGIADPSQKKPLEMTVEESSQLSVSPPPELRSELSKEELPRKDSGQIIVSASASDEDESNIEGSALKADSTTTTLNIPIELPSNESTSTPSSSTLPSSERESDSSDDAESSMDPDFLAKLPKDKIAKLKKLSAIHEKKSPQRQKMIASEKSSPVPEKTSSISEKIPPQGNRAALKIDVGSLSPDSDSQLQSESQLNLHFDSSPENPNSNVYQWKSKYTLRSHFDGVRSLSFHQSDPLLVSASEDGTAKLWNLRYVGSVGTKKTINSPDIEPVFTYRGHMGPVFSVSMSKMKDTFFSAGADSVIKYWELPGISEEPYSAYGRAQAHKIADLIGHTDVIWSIDTHPLQNVAVTASADGTAKLWDPEKPSPLLNTFSTPGKSGKGMTPTSAVFIPSDLKKVMVGYTNGAAAIFDIETSKCVTYLDHIAHPTEGSVGRVSQINQLACHPTLPLVISAHDDKCIRYIDVTTGSVAHSMVAHTNAVSSISIEASGLNFLSTGHDSSIRFWDVGSKKCVQEFTAHRNKFDETVHCAIFHPTKHFVASGGADSHIKIFQ